MGGKLEPRQFARVKGIIGINWGTQSLVTPWSVGGAVVAIAFFAILFVWVIGDLAGDDLVRIALGGVSLGVLCFMAAAGVAIYRSNRSNTQQLFQIGNQLAEQRLAAEAAEASEARYRGIADSAVEAIVSMDRQGNIIYWNNGAQRVFGYGAEEMLGKPLHVLMPERYREAHQSGLARFNATNEAHVIGTTLELRGLKNDGAEFPLELSISTWKRAGETFYSSIIRDMSERKREEEMARETEARYRALADSAVEAIIFADSEGNINYWNTAAQSIFGYQEEEALGMSLALLMPERYRVAHREGLERFGATGDPHVIGKIIELHGLRKDGSEFPLEASFSSWKTGEGTFYSSIIRDISKRKAAEQDLTNAQELTDSQELNNTNEHLDSALRLLSLLSDKPKP